MIQRYNILLEKYTICKVKVVILENKMPELKLNCLKDQSGGSDRRQKLVKSRSNLSVKSMATDQSFKSCKRGKSFKSVYNCSIHGLIITFKLVKCRFLHRITMWFWYSLNTLLATNVILDIFKSQWNVKSFNLFSLFWRNIHSVICKVYFPSDIEKRVCS